MMASTVGNASSVRTLALELKSLCSDPLEGIRQKLINESNLFEWEVALFGPPDTLYQGGYFKVRREKHLKVPFAVMAEAKAKPEKLANLTLLSDRKASCVSIVQYIWLNLSPSLAPCPGLSWALRGATLLDLH